ncbi:uncharacterized protein V6R79_014831 [Siganus canaliculatus]
MKRRYTVSEALDYIFDHHSDEEKTDSEEGLEEDVSEIEDGMEYKPDQKSDGEESSDEEEDDLAEAVTFMSRNGILSWSSSPPGNQGRLSAENVNRMTPGPTKYATSQINEITSCFELFLIDSIVTIVVNMTNLEGKRIYGDNWKDVTQTDIRAYVGLLILTGVYRSRN